MKDKLYDNADSFAMSFDKEWENIDCEDLRLKIDKVFNFYLVILFLVLIRKMQEKWLNLEYFH